MNLVHTLQSVKRPPTIAMDGMRLLPTFLQAKRSWGLVHTLQSVKRPPTITTAVARLLSPLPPSQTLVGPCSHFAKYETPTDHRNGRHEVASNLPSRPNARGW